MSYLQGCCIQLGAVLDLQRMVALLRGLKYGLMKGRDTQGRGFLLAPRKGVVPSKNK